MSRGTPPISPTQPGTRCTPIPPSRQGRAAPYDETDIERSTGPPTCLRPPMDPIWIAVITGLTIALVGSAIKFGGSALRELFLSRPDFRVTVQVEDNSILAVEIANRSRRHLSSHQIVVAGPDRSAWSW